MAKKSVYKTREYSTWADMKQRCLNPKIKGYENYGGRGISVCSEWLIFLNFYRDMGDRPEGHSLDRIDNNGNYEPSNCRWATSAEQALNRFNIRILEYNGEIRPISEWAKIVGLSYSTLNQRVLHGWPVDKALFLPPDKRKPNVNGDSCGGYRYKDQARYNNKHLKKFQDGLLSVGMKRATVKKIISKMFHLG
jgi:hypothetical protein